jgi:hypothetical protein
MLTNSNSFGAVMRPKPQTSEPTTIEGAPEVLLHEPRAEGEHRVTVDPFLSVKLRPHQIEGVKFMFARLAGTHNPDFRGCINADSMGLVCATLSTFSSSLAQPFLSFFQNSEKKQKNGKKKTANPLPFYNIRYGSVRVIIKISCKALSSALPFSPFPPAGQDLLFDLCYVCPAHSWSARQAHLQADPHPHSFLIGVELGERSAKVARDKDSTHCDGRQLGSCNQGRLHAFFPFFLLLMYNGLSM